MCDSCWGGVQQLVAGDLNNIPIIELGDYWGNIGYFQSVDINKETKIITGTTTNASINVDNNGKLISRVPSFFQAGISIKNNSNAIFENEVFIEHPYLHIINNSTVVFNEKLDIMDGDLSWPVIEQDNDFSGGSLLLDNSTLDNVMNQWGSVNLGNNFSQSDIGSDGIFSHKASRAYNRLKLQQDTARNRGASALMAAATAANTNANLNVLARSAAEGGYLFKDGGSINIKPSRKGTFTAAAKRHGKGVQEFATHVLANKEDYSPAMVKKANFASNSRHWSHDYGGNLNKYIEGQEYDVTEEEIKLLKKLGYEFEYL